jgi:hypothetical protein
MGRFTLLPQAEDSPFTLSVKFRDVQADQIVANAGGAKGMVTGRLEGYLDAGGTTADPNALSGVGEIILRDGQVQQYSLLIALGAIAANRRTAPTPFRSGPSEISHQSRGCYD